MQNDNNSNNTFMLDNFEINSRVLGGRSYVKPTMQVVAITNKKKIERATVEIYEIPITMKVHH